MLGVIEAGASVLAEFTRAVALRLQWPEPVVKLFGGLFAHHDDYAALFRMRLSVLLPGSHVEVCREGGAPGAVWLADHCIPRTTSATAAPDRGSLAQASTEQSNPRSATLDAMTPQEMVDLFANEEEYVVNALRAQRENLARAVELVSTALTNGGRLFYIGAGTSGRLGVLDASEIPPTFGASPELVQGIIAGGALALHRAIEGAEDQPEGGALAIKQRGVGAADVVCGIAASGRTPFVLGGLAEARAAGARTILLTCNSARTRTGWDVEIDLPVGPEIVTGSTRLKAGTATKVALNLISTAAMVRLGRVKGNRMVDLGISNEKLRDRGTRMVADALQLSYTEARTRLEAANWNVRACLDGAGRK
jgi:N-acetylmuramic acid 6-phosphate etherase